MKMWQRISAIILMLLSVNIGPLLANNGGNPFYKNYQPSVYHAHNRNFDIVADDYGRVFVANFEGLLYYDQAEWHVIHAPGIYRFTQLYKDSTGRIWFGGYNLFGYLTAAANGELQLNYIFSEKNKGALGDVVSITEANGKICLETSLGNSGLEDSAMEDYVVKQRIDREVETFNGFSVNQKIVLPDHSVLLATSGAGFFKLDDKGRIVYALSEKNGLCNNNVNAIHVDSLGYVWGATDKGIFLVNVNTAYTHFGPSEGLLGEVQSICNTPEGLYVGTLRGLFRQKEGTFESIPSINYACWDLQPRKEGGVLVSTARGVYAVHGGELTQITSNHTLSLCSWKNGEIFTGETDGVYRLYHGNRQLLNTVEKVTRFLQEGDSVLWARNIYGEIFRCAGDMRKAELISVKDETGKQQTETLNNEIFKQNGQIYVVSHLGLFVWNSTSARLEKVALEQNSGDNIHEYPQFVHPEKNQLVWTTNRVGKHLNAFSKFRDVRMFNKAVKPVESYVVQCMESADGEIWMGGGFGIIHWDSTYREPDFDLQQHLYVRRVVLNGDSVIWGGFGTESQMSAEMPLKRLSFEDGTREVRFEFSANTLSALGDIQYQYRLNENDAWSGWSTATSATIVNPRAGNYRFEVMARDRYGKVTEPVSVELTIAYPFYLRWYCWIGYAVLLSLFIFFLVKWRMRRLLQEKQRLEAIVESRTSQIRQQKDEIEEKSKNLEQALEDLNKAQFELIRQEKMATVGTLTQGLVDRILNPMNYVNNFSHMSIGLVQDMQQDVDDDKEKMTPDIYDDCLDILDMLTTNLQKIEEHGLNTTRILKAMEEMLKERTGKMTETDLAALCRKNIEMLNSYNETDITTAKIQLEAPAADVVLMAEVDAEQMSKTIMSILANSMYAIKKKVGRVAFEPVIRLAISTEGDNVRITAYDNGIGIEASIMDKLFDPFFTTKTTAEAVGVGLFISREVIRNHGGDIVIQSKKDEYTEVGITFPIHQLNRK